MSTRCWLCVYAGCTAAAAGLLLLYAFWDTPIPWYRWFITMLVLWWFAGLTHGMTRRLQYQRAVQALLQEQEEPHA